MYRPLPSRRHARRARPGPGVGDARPTEPRAGRPVLPIGRRVTMSDALGRYRVRVAGPPRDGLVLVVVDRVACASAACPGLAAGDRLLIPAAELAAE